MKTRPLRIGEMFCYETGKHSYESFTVARRALKRIKKHRPPQRKERGIYHCPFCEKYHLTAKKQRKAS